MDLKQFKEDLRGRVADFAVSGYLINVGDRKSNEKEMLVEQSYQKLEKWILQQISPVVEYPIHYQTSPSDKFVPTVESVSENQIELDF